VHGERLLPVAMAMLPCTPFVCVLSVPTSRRLMLAARKATFAAATLCEHCVHRVLCVLCRLPFRNSVRVCRSI
jgi:hypothetical protein